MSASSLEIAADQMEMLAKAAFPDLLEGEKKMVRAACTPQSAFFGPDGDKGALSNAPEFSESGYPEKHITRWGPERNLRGEVVRWLCVNPKTKVLVDPRGIQLVGARIISQIDLSYADVPFRVSFKRCRLLTETRFTESQIPELDLEGSWTGPIAADGAHILHNLNLRFGFRAEGKVSLIGTRIDGSFGCGESSFINPNDIAIAADAATVGGAVLLRAGTTFTGGVTPFRAVGAVRVFGAKIGGDVDCDGGVFIYRSSDPDAAALNLERAEVKGALLVRAHHDEKGKPDTPFRVDGALNLRDASVGSIEDDYAGWPAPGQLNVYGFVYKGIASDVKDARIRLQWLERDASDSTQPYRQLAKVLKDTGDSAGAQLVLEKMEARIAARDGWPGPPTRLAKATIG